MTIRSSLPLFAAFALLCLSAGPARAQIDPEWIGYVLHVGGAAQGELDVDPVNDTATFHWANATVAWSSTFKAIDAGTAPSTAVSDTYENPGFGGSTGSYDISGCQWQVESEGTVIGWLYRSGSGLIWYGKAAYVGTDGHFDVDSVVFAPNTGTGSVTVHKLSVDEI